MDDDSTRDGPGAGGPAGPGRDRLPATERTAQARRWHRRARPAPPPRAGIVIPAQRTGS